MPVVDYEASPTLAKFIKGRKFYSLACGNRGSGKSTAGLFRTIMLANEQKKQYYPLRWAVVRDTRKNLGLTLARTIKQWLPEPYCHWRGKPEEPECCDIYIGDKKHLVHILHFDFFGINSPADHDRFQSYEASGVWIEEPCPLRTNTEFISSGVSESVLATAITCLRGSPYPSIQLTMNPPSADHWVAQLFHLPGYEACADMELEMPPDQLRIREQIRQDTSIFMVPMAENAAERVTPGYMERNRQILLATGHTDLYARLVEGRVGYVDVGVRVMPEFCGAHLAAGIRVIPNVPLILAWDFGLYATCIAAQVSPQGYLLIHKAWSRENTGVQQLCRTLVQPWLAEQDVKTWWYCGGHEAKEREQSNSEESALRTIVRELGHAPYKPAPISWSARRLAGKEGLERYISGIPWIRVDPQGAAMLVRSLDGGWSYEVTPSEQVRNEQVPPKGRFSHLGDAFLALCAVLLRKTDAQSRSVQRSYAPTVKYPVSVPGYAGSSRRCLISSMNL
jgi:hypothetical protein